MLVEGLYSREYRYVCIYNDKAQGLLPALRATSFLALNSVNGFFVCVRSAVGFCRAAGSVGIHIRSTHVVLQSKVRLVEEPKIQQVHLLV